MSCLWFLWHPKSAETFKEKNKNFTFLEILKFQHNVTKYIESQTNKEREIMGFV